MPGLKMVVLGGSSGIGAGIANLYASRGHEVVRLQRTNTSGWKLDLRDSAATIVRTAQDVGAALCGVDRLVVAGGIGAYQRALYGALLRSTDRDATVEEFAATVDEQIRTNLTGPALVVEALAPFMQREAGTSKLLWIGSVIVKNPPYDLAYYSAAKAGAQTFVHAFAKRWASRGIRANTFATGWIETPMVADLKPDKRKLILDAIPLHRFGTVEEVATAAEWIMEYAPDYFSGSVLPMSGGL